MKLALAGLVAVVALHAGSARADEPEVLRRADAIAAEVARARGLAIKRPIQRDVMTREQIRARLGEMIDRQYTKEEIAVEERVLKRFGMLPADASYLQLYVDLATEQIAGFYDPWEGKLYLTDDAGEGGGEGFADERLVMAHEIVHALQDQHFDLRKFMQVGKDNGDAEMARQALTEGDGMAVMIELMFAQLKQPPPWGDPAVSAQLAQIFDMGGPVAGDTDGLARAPLFMQVGMMFPYAKGLAFVMHVRRLHPWKAVDAVYRKPPLSTEHVLHPATYDAYEKPVKVTDRPVPALAAYRRIYGNVTGELGFSVMLRQHGVDRATAEEAAKGWGGDRMAVYAPKQGDDGMPGSALAVSYSAWDSEIDAIEFYEAAAAALPSLSGGGEALPAAEGAAQVDLVAYRGKDGAAYAVERRGDVVVILVGGPAAAADDVRSGVLERWKRDRRAR